MAQLGLIEVGGPELAKLAEQVERNNTEADRAWKERLNDIERLEKELLEKFGADVLYGKSMRWTYR